MADTNDLINRGNAILAVTERIRQIGLDDDPRALSIRQSIRDLPSAQPEIVRCRDCKYFADEGMYCAQDIIVQFDHFYCYYAERRE